jgi:hypothetical protein
LGGLPKAPITSYLGQLDSQYLYPLRSLDGLAIPPGTGCSF